MAAWIGLQCPRPCAGILLLSGVVLGIKSTHCCLLYYYSRECVNEERVALVS